jgi:hypothetical protein
MSFPHVTQEAVKLECHSAIGLLQVTPDASLYTTSGTSLDLSGSTLATAMTV